MLKSLKKKIRNKVESSPSLKKYLYVSPWSRIPYFIAQRIFRVNGKVPWPVHWSSIVTAPDKIKIDDFRPYLGFMPGQYIQAMNGIIIGKNLRIAVGVKIMSASHELNDYSKHTKNNPIHIGDNCWLAANVLIMPNVTLGDHVVVAAGAVVTKSFGSNVLIGGNPAKVIKELSDYVGDVSKW